MTARCRARAPLGEAGPVESHTDADSLAPYLEDAAHVPGGHSTGLVRPRTERDVANVLTSSARVLAIGAQSSLTGGATPRGDRLLSTARLRTIEDLPDGRLRVGAGVTIAEIDAWLAERGALYPPGPTWPGATIGGTIATNAAGPATFKYGSTRRWVDALTLVLTTGDVLDIRRGEVTAHPDGWFELELARGVVRVPVPGYRMPDVLKLSAGYYAAPGMDLIDLVIGSEGTLGVVTEATLRTVRPRPTRALVFVTFRHRSRALACVDQMRAASTRTWQVPDDAGLDVSAIEHMDRRCLDIVREDGVDVRLGLSLDAGAEIGLLIAIDLAHGTTAASAYDQLAGAKPGPLASLAALLGAFDALDDAVVAVPGDEATAGRLLALREAVPLGVNQRVGLASRTVDARISKTAADIVVPVGRVDALLACVDDQLRRRGLDGAVWGHISDGNLHPNVLPRNLDELQAGREAMMAVGLEALACGGSPLAEHGVGRSDVKRALLRAMYGELGIDQMRRVKRAFDPDGVLARGVLFDWDA